MEKEKVVVLYDFLVLVVFCVFRISFMENCLTCVFFQG